MHAKTVVHKGLMLECKVCSPETKTKEKREKRSRVRGNLTLDVYVRRQVAGELGEDDPGKDERFQLLQKYGIAAARIDRQVTRPNWMGVAEWKRKLNDWYKMTKGMVSAQQTPRREYPSAPSQQKTSPVLQLPQKYALMQDKGRRVSTPLSPIGYRPRDTRESHRSFGPTRTGSRQN